MKKLKYSLFILATVLLLFACVKDEEKLTPSDINEFGYLIPQGNNSFDQRIVDYYNRYGVYMLYKFTPRDAYWTITKWDSAYRLMPADPNYVDNQLDLIDTTFFSYYQDSTLRKYLPVKFLLCSSILLNGSGAQLDGFLTRPPGLSETGYNYETFLTNWGGSRILNIRGVKDSGVIFRGNINYSFLRLMDLKNKIGRSDLFIASADYTTPIINTTQAQRFKRGFLSTSASTTPPAAQTDWLFYIQAIVQNPYTVLTNATGMTANNATPQGMLTPVKDSLGLIRKKYDLIIDYYKTNYNIDLQKIGDGRR